MSWLSQPTLLAILLGYLIFLFLVATAGETFAHRLSHPRIRTVTYVLAANAPAGLLFGWLFRRRGLESAMLAHGAANVWLHAALPALLA